jgi:hypothetical protein
MPRFSIIGGKAYRPGQIRGRALHGKARVVGEASRGGQGRGGSVRDREQRFDSSFGGTAAAGARRMFTMPDSSAGHPGNDEWGPAVCDS